MRFEKKLFLQLVIFGINNNQKYKNKNHVSDYTSSHLGHPRTGDDDL